MENIDLHTFPHYSACEKIVREMGFNLVELKIMPSKGVTRIYAVVAAQDTAVSISVNDCSKIHRALLPTLEELLGTDDTYMELTSPGLERTIKNAAEFKFFVGRTIRVWTSEISEWQTGTLTAVDGESLTLGGIGGADGGKRIMFSDIAKAKFTNA